jgi:hypothetical protein
LVLHQGQSKFRRSRDSQRITGWKRYGRNVRVSPRDRGGRVGANADGAALINQVHSAAICLTTSSVGKAADLVLIDWDKLAYPNLDPEPCPLFLVAAEQRRLGMCSKRPIKS